LRIDHGNVLDSIERSRGLQPNLERPTKGAFVLPSESSLSVYGQKHLESGVVVVSREDRIMMFRGRGRLGDTATPGTFLAGAKVWQSPSAGFTAAQGVFSNTTTAFSSTQLPYTLGVLAVPALLIFLVMGMGKK
jgi:hypothetical protein